MRMVDAFFDSAFGRWLLGVIGTLIAAVFWVTHSKIDNNAKTLDKKIESHKQEVKGDFMKNDRDHKEFWDLHNKADETRQEKCISRIEYEKDLKHISDAVTRIEGYTQITTKLLMEHMGKDK